MSDYLRLKAELILIPLIILGVLMFILTFTRAEPMPVDIFTIETQSAPEGTFYTDVLAEKKKIGEEYISFTETPIFRNSEENRNERLCDIGAESNIAKYDQDGFVSLSLHRKNSAVFVSSECSTYICIFTDEYEFDEQYFRDDIFEYLMPADDVCKKYGSFRLAYVDREGNVLGVTDTVRRKYKLKGAWRMNADGSEASFETSELPLPAEIIISVLIIAVPFEFVVLCVLLIIGAWKFILGFFQKGSAEEFLDGDIYDEIKSNRSEK